MIEGWVLILFLMFISGLLHSLPEPFQKPPFLTQQFKALAASLIELFFCLMSTQRTNRGGTLVKRTTPLVE